MSVRSIVITVAVIAVLTLFGASGADPLFWLLSTVLGVVAIDRAVRLVIWGVRRARAGEAEELETPLSGTSARRLLAWGGALGVTSLFLTGAAWAFFSLIFEGVEFDDFQRLHAVKNEAAYQIAYGRHQEKLHGHVEFDRQRSGKSYITREFAETPHFVLHAPPVEAPFFPYNLLYAQSSYRIDETGDVRMTRVRSTGRRCPPDAPVVDRVDDVLIDAALDNLTMERASVE